MLFFVSEKLLVKKNRGKTLSVLYNQLKNSIDKKFDLNKIIFAYEPVWSIGTGKTPHISYLLEITTVHKKFFQDKKIY